MWDVFSLSPDWQRVYILAEGFSKRVLSRLIGGTFFFVGGFRA